MITLIPHSTNVIEANDCHNPAGPGGGQFCSSGWTEDRRQKLLAQDAANQASLRRATGETGAVGVEIGKKSGDWQVKNYYFPPGGDWSATHRGSTPLSVIVNQVTDWNKNDQQFSAAVTAWGAQWKVPSGHLRVYRIGSPGGTSLGGKNAGNADGVANFWERSEEHLSSTGNTVHAFDVQLQQPIDPKGYVHARFGKAV